MGSHLFNILYDKVDNMYKALLLCTEVQWSPGEKALIQLFWVETELAAFFKELHHYMKQWQTNKLCFQTWVFGQHFLKYKPSVSLSLQGKQLTVFVADGNEHSSKKIENF